jgi:hypothetical protein
MVYKMISILSFQLCKLDEEKIFDGKQYDNFVWIKKFVALHNKMSLVED